MTGIDLAVVVGGIAAIAWVNWYFFVAGRTPAAAPASNSDHGDRSDGGVRDGAKHD
jgi:hypothetical protein